jgi:hypothetical protein
MMNKTGVIEINEKMIKNVCLGSRQLKVIVKCALILILFSSSFADASYNIVKDENIFNESNASKEFSMLYVDGFGANSGGFKLILRTYERRSGSNFKSLLVDIEYILSSQDKVVYSKRVEQIPLSDTNGEIVLTHRPSIALEEGKSYTGMARIYLYKDGIPEYYLTAVSTFTARSDAEITEVFGDSIGASATIKSKSMIPLNAKIIFTLRKDNVVVGTREVEAPSIMANDKEKTVNVLWTNNLNPGKYMLSLLLDGSEIIDEHDKIFTIEKRTAAISNSTGQNEEVPKASGFTSLLAILVLVTIVLRRRN